MPGLTDKLKSLGVNVGAGGLKPVAARPTNDLDRALSGQPLLTPQGETYLIESQFPPDQQPELTRDRIDSDFSAISTWAGLPQYKNLHLADVVFLDTETTGLSGGTGTYAFLIGIGWFDGSRFSLNQLFMREPLEEPAQLSALESILARFQAIVTFNGKSFDAPLLNTRFLMNGLHSPLLDLGHYDLLHLARRLWRDRLASRSLGSLEINILGAGRSQEDIPGWAIPQIYFDYLRSGDTDILKGVMYHNAMDVLSLAGLFKHLCAILSDPLQANLDHGVDFVALARLAEDMGNPDLAIQLYLRGLEFEDNSISSIQPQYRLSSQVLVDAVHRLAAIHKKREEYDSAVSLWVKAAQHNHIQAHLELAKFYEHRLKNYPEALHWTESAIELVKSTGFPIYERLRWLPELETRQSRLKRKHNSGI